LGAHIERFCPVTGAARVGEKWVLDTPKGQITCDIVVNAAGYYAREVGKMFGRDLPMMVMSHQYLVIDTVPEIEARTKETGRKLPLLRATRLTFVIRGDSQNWSWRNATACKALHKLCHTKGRHHSKHLH
jgi:dimethylglycine dehydrogenase